MMPRPAATVATKPQRRRVATPVVAKPKRQPPQGATILTPIAAKLHEAINTLLSHQQEEVLAFVRAVKHNTHKPHPNPEPTGTTLARLMQKAEGKNLFSSIKDPVAWQRKIRKDKPLTGRTY